MKHAGFSGADFSWENAHLATMLASGIHGGEGGFADLVWDLGWSYRWFHLNSLEAALVYDENQQILVFRGSQSAEDWTVNLDALSIETALGRAHRGFWVAAQAFHSRIQSELIPDLPIWCVGHSLGGALAELSALRLKLSQMYRGNSDESSNATPGRFQALWTTGQPMVGKADFAQSADRVLEKKFFRLANENDVVTKLPMGFAHSGQQILFATGGKVQIGDEPAVTTLAKWDEKDRLINILWRDSDKIDLREMATEVTEFWTARVNTMHAHLTSNIQTFDHRHATYVSRVIRQLNLSEGALDGDG